MFSPLDIFLSTFWMLLISWVVFFWKNRIPFLFRFVLFSGWFSLIIFTIFPFFLQKLWLFFWLERGADLLVYVSILFLLYFFLYLLKDTEKIHIQITRLIRELAIQNKKNQEKLIPEKILVIACYNEEKVIKQTIKTILQNHEKFHIIIINDWSTDKSQNILENLANTHQNITILSHSQNLWQWAAIETGFEYIRRNFQSSKYVATFDADGQHHINDVLKMIKILDENPKIQITLGSRFLDKSSTSIPFFRKIILKLWIIFTKMISGISLTDTHNGLRVFRAEALAQIKITIDGMWHASEIIDIIASQKISFKEVPVTISYTDYSLSKGQKSSNSIKIAFKMILKKFF